MISPPETEPETISAARAGDPAAFAVLYNETRSDVFRYIRSRVRDEYTAEDLTSETYLKAFRRIDTFTWQGRNFGAWLMTIARHLVADHYRSSRVRREVAMGDMLDTDQAEDSAENRGLRALEAVEAREAVETAMLSLCPGQADVVRLRFLAELSLAESSAVMGRSTGAVKQMTVRAFAAMRLRLDVAA